MANATLHEHDERAPAAGDDFGRTWSDAAELFELRRRLAEAEIKSDLATGKRLAIVGGIGAVLSLAGLPLLCTALAQYLSTVTSLGFVAWLLILGGPLLALGLSVVVFAWHRFRRDFLALSATRQEFREDLVWLQEWLGQKE